MHRSAVILNSSPAFPERCSSIPYPSHFLHRGTLLLLRVHSLHIWQVGRVGPGSECLPPFTCSASLARPEAPEIRTGTAVASIVVENGAAKGVRLEDGEEERADIVVSNADVTHTYRDLLASEPRRKWRDRKLE